MDKIIGATTGKIWRFGSGRKFSLLLWLQYTYSFFKIYKEVFNVEGVWPSPNILPTMVHGQAFYIITLTTQNEMETPLNNSVGRTLGILH